MIELVPGYTAAEARAKAAEAEVRQATARALYDARMADAQTAPNDYAARICAGFADLAACEARHWRKCGNDWDKLADDIEKHQGMEVSPNGG